MLFLRQESPIFLTLGKTIHSNSLLLAISNQSSKTSILSLLYNPELCANVVKQARLDVKNKYNWTKIAQDTHFTYQKAICQTMAEKQARQLAQEEAQKTKKAKNSEKEITNLLGFKKRQAYA